VIGERLGPYRILSELGAGGMGTVYLAEGDEGKVALKVIHPHLVESGGIFKRFLREAELGRRVVDGHVVATLGAGHADVEGRRVHYLVMEFVQGRTLREMLASLGAFPEALLREVALQAAAGLVAIHAARIVHRDLKPENILITDDQRVRIMDLGVAKLQEATFALTSEGQFAGSLLYAAPEQLTGDQVGPAADLYSLGVVLYELATAENPFRRDGAGAIIHAQLDDVPARADDRNPEVSPFLAEVIATLLAKKPAERFASAELLKSVLEEGERSSWWGEREARLRRLRAALPTIRVRRETSLLARDDALAELRHAWSEARRGKGRPLLVEGEAGIGKTRLVDEFVRSLEGQEVHVLYGAYPPHGATGGFWEALRNRFPGDLVTALSGYLEVTPSLVPAFAALVRNDSPPPGSAPLAPDAVATVACHLVRALAAEKPCLWIVEDLQFADAAGRGLFLALARAIEGHRVLLLGTTQPGLPAQEFGALPRIALRRLGAREVIELLREAFRSEHLARKLGGTIAYKSDGVPFFVFELIRALKEGRFVEVLPDGTYIQTEVISDLEVPSAVKDLLEARMRDLDRDQRAILDVAAVEGVAFDPALVAAVLDMKKVQVLRELAEIERRLGLVHCGAGLTRFDHNQLQEVLYQQLPPDLRAEYHALLADAFHAREGEQGGGGEGQFFLAYHHLRGSRPREALPHLERALRHLEQAQRHEIAADVGRRALPFLEGPERVRLLVRLARLEQILGQPLEERRAAEEAVALADTFPEEKGLRAEARHALALSLSYQGNAEQAQALMAEAVRLAEEAGDRRREMLTRRGLGTLALRADLDEAERQYERSLALAREIGDRDGETAALINLGIVAWHRGDLAASEARYLEGLALARAEGHLLWESNAIGNLGALYSDMARLEEAREQMVRQLELARQIGHRLGEANASGNLGLIAVERGFMKEAQERFQRHLELAHELADRDGIASAVGNLGAVAAMLGRFERSLELHEQRLAMARAAGNRRTEALSLSAIADVHEQRGELEEAEELYREALALRRETGPPAMIAWALVGLARVLDAEGCEAEARTAVDEACAIATESGALEPRLLAAVYRAVLHREADEGIPRELWEQPGIGIYTRLEARYRFWRATGDRAHLAEAHRLLMHLRDHAPETDCESLLTNVPLHREIVQAWEEP